ncbi:unnamed protein product [Bursaphelenchus xylophilus]|uniref:(pine wood nematode) hypothetical protein n=1 Tax=Bursaphelenchus xylophilus TaxID=6326 RepID=A0A7I8X2B2_BURXY|nr:unnamed protein product [Bursaphelenchus xylophilus]CAG9130878.1 unnamed protein product [Bursaphelenchus xylophilus]
MPSRSCPEVRKGFCSQHGASITGKGNGNNVLKKPGPPGGDYSALEEMENQEVIGMDRTMTPISAGFEARYP